MDKELKEKWVAALRSGKYEQQSRGVLKNDDGFCCLGVLAELCGVTWSSEPYSAGYFHDMGRHCNMFFGVEQGVPYLEVRQLASMNDTGHTFDQIADYIEEKL